MVAFRFSHVCIESYATHLPETEVTSAEIEDRLAPLYNRLGIPFGTLERLSGVASRVLWPKETRPSEVATVAAKKALENLPFPKEEIRALFSCSVTRDYFEPATALLVHRNLEIGENSIAMDISNACIGFSDGLVMLANLIETGIVKAGIVVTGESSGVVIDATTKLLLGNESMGREELLKVLPTFTLGCGAVAMVLCHESMSKTKHRFLGAVSRCASEFNDLCSGNGDHCVLQGREINPIMYTESTKLITSAAKLGGRTWTAASEVFGWSRDDVDHIFCHQVGRQVNEAFYREMGLDMEKEFTIYRDHGNLVSAAMPTALIKGIEGRNIQKGDKILCTAFGSGLNCLFLGIEW